MGNFEKIAACQLTSQKQEKSWSMMQGNKGRKVHFATLMDLCHFKNSEWEPEHHKYKGRVVLRGDIVKDDPRPYAVCTEQGSSASQVAAAKIMDIISRLPRCAGQAADAVSAYTQVKMEDAPSLLKNSEGRMSRYLDTSTETQMARIMVQYGTPSCSSWTKSERSSFRQDYDVKGNLRTSYWNTVGRKFPNENAYSYTVNKGYSYLCM